MVDINFRFDVIRVSAVLNRSDYDIRKRLRSALCTENVPQSAARCGAYKGTFRVLKLRNLRIFVENFFPTPLLEAAGRFFTAYAVI